MSEALKKVDSAVQGVNETAKETKKPRQSTVAAPGVYRIEDLGMLLPLCSLTWGPLADSVNHSCRGKGSEDCA